ncbi:MAG: lytic transglycosylase domain-containing protein [Rhizobiales bacterium]|nr:lytic transglycosylase domain-containing protein [Hyphomicrobiales bacterium]
MTPDVSRRHFLKGLMAASAAVALPFSALPAVAAPAVDAVRAALKDDYVTAGNLARQSGDPAAVKLVELLFLRDKGAKAGYSRIMNFLEAAPKWPLTETLLKRAEQALFESGANGPEVMAHFAQRKPFTSYGHMALCRAAYAAGDQQTARGALMRAWVNPDMDDAVEAAAIREFGSALSEADYRRRLWQLIYAQNSAAAVSHAKRMGSGYVNIAKVAQGLLRGTGGADKQYAALSSGNRSIPALRYALARYYRRMEKFGKARAILAAAPTTAADMGDPEAWWTERRILARRSVGPTHRDTWTTGYQIAAQHGLTSGDAAVEAEFLSGWIALRYLNKPDTAMRHFTNLQQIAPTRTEKARAAYWIGRTHEAAGDKGNARSAYKVASQFSTIYYGQLAREKIGMGNVPESIESGDTTSGARAAVDRDEVMRAFRIMAQAADKSQLNMFLWSISSRFGSLPEMNAAASVVHQFGGTTMALRLAKAAGQRNLDIDSYSYPVRGLPDWKQMGKPVEKALVFGLSRQESEFDPNAGSKVGAQGLMQLMPGTAKLIARQYGVAFAPGKLKGDPAYNVKLGAAHLGDLIDDFGGSYVLTLVAYNAGPRRAREWVAEFGDLRSGQVDPIDWVESIPFQETRQYVQKVLQNLHVYRSRLAPKTVRPMTADLMRGTPGEMTVASTSPTTAENTGCSGGSIKALITGCD